MTNVLLIAPTPFFADRGCHVRIYEQARQLQNHGCRLRLVTYPLGDDPPGIETERVWSPIPYRRYESGPAWTRLLLDALVLARAWSICSVHRPDLVQAYLHEGCLIGAALKLRFGIPLLFDYQGSLTEESIQHGFVSEPGLTVRLFRMAESFIEHTADLITTSSRVLAAPLLARGLPAEPLGDGVDPRRFAPGPPDPDLAARLGLPPRIPVAVYLGAMSGYQGTDLVLQAARCLKNERRSVHFLLMGYPDEEYKKLARELDVREMVTFIGRVNYFEAPALLRLGTVALAPKLARTEANGKILNYMGCGLPIAAFDIPINRELLGDDAVWVEPSPDRDLCARRLARAVMAALDDPERSERLARAGRERAVRDFSIERTGARLMEIHRELIDQARSRRGPTPRKVFRLGWHQVERAEAALAGLAHWTARTWGGRDEDELEAEHWSRRSAGKALTWQDHLTVRAAVNRRVSGDPEVNWLMWFAREYGTAGFDRGLNLGCGFGDLEAHAFTLGLVRSFHSVDLSGTAIAEARRRLAGRPVVFERADVNDFVPAPGQYDVVFAASSLHHFTRLERVLDRVSEALRPGGLFVFDEFVGPSRFQWREDQLIILNRLLGALPARYRRDLRRGCGTKRRVYLPPRDESSRDSPFEAVRSEEIIPLVTERFEVLARRDYGGTVLHPLLDRIAGNFRLDSEQDSGLLRRLVDLEDRLIASGWLNSDFTVVVARKGGG